MIKIKAITHVHSLYSDSFASLPRIKREAEKYGINCVFMADHLFRLDDFKKFVKECDELSDDNFLMVPGIEMGSREGYHFLVYNIKKLPPIADKKSSAQEMCAAFSNNKDSIFILAHASLYRQPPNAEVLEQLDGVEVWNTKYDTKLAPNMKSLRLALQHNLIPFAGVDAHGRFCIKRLWLELEAKRLDRDEIVGVLKRGDFKSVTKSLFINLKEKLTPKQEISFRRRNRFYGSVRYPVCAFVRSGFNFPEPIIRIFQKMFKWV